jgi:hypothetical protein
MQLFTGLSFVLQQQLALIGTSSSGDKHKGLKRICRVIKLLIQTRICMLHGYFAYGAAGASSTCTA